METPLLYPFVVNFVFIVLEVTMRDGNPFYMLPQIRRQSATVLEVTMRDGNSVVRRVLSNMSRTSFRSDYEGWKQSILALVYCLYIN